MNPLLFLAVLFHNPGMFFSVIYRIENYLLSNTFVVWKIIGAVLYPFYFIVTYYVLDINISPLVKIDKSLYIHNRGVIVADGSVAGNNLTLIGPLTLGTKGHSRNLEVPKLGNGVTVFIGARIVGRVTIGNNVQIGANAVVVKDVPSNSVVGGVPAKILRRTKE
ncbi:MAG: Hexapeptide transferase family protein [Candidatus Woesebacteria bacterium GW2011_GWB1_39_10]|uniref:Serine acetyltransferase n=2 Tax=Candidatus Woeseibacteriota TaxID=1752722 RepID=A0A0G0LIT8_9BACT|nr:MAG: Hexapeptide transferase family protein [Candidatus Woesebacteria bacterium GW2011_GWB1_39_10]KKS90808.1 MAG: Hexapeptide transferase family protein [Candidatus Woesebacteria bacterium GW2011_GWA1_43_12]